MACHTPTPFFVPVSRVSEHAENNCHVTFLTLLHNRDRVYITYCHLHVILNSSHVWQHLPISSYHKQDKKLPVFYLLITIKLARLLLLCVSLYACILFCHVFMSIVLYYIVSLCYLANLATIKIYIHTPWVKKGDTILLSISLLNIDRFS